MTNLDMPSSVHKRAMVETFEKVSENDAEDYFIALIA